MTTFCHNYVECSTKTPFVRFTSFQIQRETRKILELPKQFPGWVANLLAMAMLSPVRTEPAVYCWQNLPGSCLRYLLSRYLVRQSISQVVMLQIRITIPRNTAHCEARLQKRHQRPKSKVVAEIITYVVVLGLDLRKASAADTDATNTRVLVDAYVAFVDACWRAPVLKQANKTSFASPMVCQINNGRIIRVTHILQFAWTRQNRPRSI